MQYFISHFRKENREDKCYLKSYFSTVKYYFLLFLGYDRGSQNKLGARRELLSNQIRAGNYMRRIETLNNKKITYDIRLNY